MLVLYEIQGISSGCGEAPLSFTTSKTSRGRGGLTLAQLTRDFPEAGQFHFRIKEYISSRDSNSDDYVWADLVDPKQIINASNGQSHVEIKALPLYFDDSDESSLLDEDEDYSDMELDSQTIQHQQQQQQQQQQPQRTPVHNDAVTNARTDVVIDEHFLSGSSSGNGNRTQQQPLHNVNFGVSDNESSDESTSEDEDSSEDESSSGSGSGTSDSDEEHHSHPKHQRRRPHDHHHGEKHNQQQQQQQQQQQKQQDWSSTAGPSAAAAAAAANAAGKDIIKKFSKSSLGGFFKKGASAARSFAKEVSVASGALSSSPSSAQRRVLQLASKDMTTPLAVGNREHDGMLMYLWSAALTDDDYAPRDSRWKLLGTSKDSPLDDLRSSGAFGLRCLVHFCKTRRGTFTKMIQRNSSSAKGTTYRVIVAAGKVSRALATLLGIDGGRYEDMSRPFWKMFDSPNVILEIFCAHFALFDAVFVHKGDGGDGGGANVDMVVQESTRLLKSVLDEGPTSIPEMFTAASGMGLPMKPE